ncbi:MAG TPA: hypothetical protein VF870_06655 [Ignavibacteriaceae bacterium]|jgi:hypothetical protein
MKWFYIKFTNEELVAKRDTKFINQFLKLLQYLDHPENLGLYSLRTKMNEGLVYYASTPPEVSYKLRELLIHYRSKEVSRPNLNVLRLELGKSEILEDQLIFM